MSRPPRNRLLGWLRHDAETPGEEVRRKPASPPGFSEDALKKLEDLEARLPPPEAYEQLDPAAFRMAERLTSKASAGGGLIPGPDGKLRPHYWGHRSRLRERFLNGGHASMPDYELLELLLFNAIQKIDVKPLAKRLLHTFGDLNGVIAASKFRILQVEGADEWVYLQLRIVEAFAHRMALGRMRERSVIDGWDELISYCRTVMAHRETEQFRILFLDNKSVLIADEAQAQGTVNHVPVYPREVAKRALELNASAIILVHNHPSGDTEPSDDDIRVTDRIVAACDALGIRVHDHIIIGSNDEVSFKTLGYLL